MSTFYYNNFSNKNRESQWIEHLQNQSYIEDVNKSFKDSTKKQTQDFSGFISQQTKEFNNSIREASREQVLAIQESTNAVCGTLNAGFDLLSDNLQDISYSIDELRSEVSAMSSMLNWKLSLLIEHQRITNLLLGNIAVLLRIPDIQKERQYHIEQGIKFLKNAIFDSDFYEDSLNNLLKAEKIEPADFFALHRIGLIYLYSQKHLELSKAEEYFKKAAKYAVAESNVGATITTNYLSGDLNKNLAEQKPSIDSIKLQAAEAYMFAGRSCYIQGKLNEAAEYARKGFSLVPQLVEAGFTQAKALAANNDETQAALVLEKVINTDRFYSLKTLSDLDLCPKPSIRSLLKKLQKEATDKAIGTLQYCKKQIIVGSNATEYLNKVERLINKNTYLTSKKAIDLFEKIKGWYFCEPLKNSNQSDSFNELVSIVNSFLQLKHRLVDTISIMRKDLEKLTNYSIASTFIQENSFTIDNDTYIKKINTETQWIFPLSSAIERDLNWKNEIKSKVSNLNIVQFIELEKNYNDSLPKVITDLNNLLGKVTNESNLYMSSLKNQRDKLDNSNLTSSVGSGILGGLGGVVGGLVIGFCVGLIVQIASCISNDWTEKGSGKYSGIIIVFSMIIGGIIGYVANFNSKRKKLG